MIENFPVNPLKGQPNANRMSFWREWLKDKDIKTILELGRNDGYGSTWYFVESGAEVWSVDLSGEIGTGLISAPVEQLGAPGGLPVGSKVGDMVNCFAAVELKAFPNFHMIIADDTQPIPEIDGRRFDLIFVDTSHGYGHTKQELKRYFPMADKWFAIDDYHWSTETPAINEFEAENGHLFKFEFIGGNDIYGVMMTERIKRLLH